MNRLLLLLPSTAALAACASTMPPPSFVESTLLKAPKPTEYRDADAVDLLRDERYTLSYGRDGKSFNWYQAHQARAVLTAKGRDVGTLRLGLGRRTLELFEGRTIGPDGSITRVLPEHVKTETTNKGDTQLATTLIITFPKVEIGSVLEWRLSARGDGYYGSLSDLLGGPYPTRRATLEITGNEPIQYQVMAYNTDAQWVTQKTSDGWSVRIAVDDLPASAREPYSPAPVLVEPCWVFSIGQIQHFVDTFAVNRTWSDAMDWLAARLTFPDDAPRPTVKLEGSPRDKLAALHAHARARWTVGALGDLPGGDLAKLDEQPTITAVERGRALLAMLRGAGLEAHAALVNGPGEALDDLDIPYADAFRRLLILVPKQKGLDAPVWIAPECDACRLGEVPSMLIDREALVLRAKQRPGNVSADVEARMEPVASRPLGLATSLRTYSATVSDTLDLALRWTTANEDHAWLGPRKDARVEPLSKLKKDAETSLRERLPGSALLEYVPFTLDPSLRRGTRTFVAEAPAHAVADRETRTVPLTMLTDVIGDDFEARTRRTLILVKSPSVTRDELRLRVPAGWKLTGAPNPVNRTAAGFTCQARVIEEAPGLVRVTRSLEERPGEWPASDYAAIRAVHQACRGVRLAALVFTAAR
jgi:hypothetical protein